MPFFCRTIGVALFLAMLAVGCVEPFQVDRNYDTDLITVEATLTDLPEPQFVRLRRSISNARDNISQLITGLKAEVIVNGQGRVALTEQSPGDYYLPEKFATTVGATYQLRFQDERGIWYESTAERMPSSAPITRIEKQYDPQAIQITIPGSPQYIRPGHRVYIDTQDPAATRDYYHWTWKLWEKQPTCASCLQGRYYLGSGCLRDWSINEETTYDYFCDRPCWAIFRNRQINVMADSYSNGRLITGREVGRIPYYTDQGALLEIRQNVVTAGAFRYLRLLADQIQNTGSLADTPPASVFGNVANATDANDKLVGYFTVASVSRVRYWLDRRDVPTTARSIGLLGGRPMNPEPAAPSRPPLAPCSPDDTRTPLRPEGWQGS